MVIYWWRYRQASKRGELEGPKDHTSGEVSSDSATQDTSIISPTTDLAKERRRFNLFVYALLLAYIAVLVRCMYR
jgi:hypothetical protein